MHDPFPIGPIPLLSKAIQPFADYFSLPTLPLHIHEVVFAFLGYTFINVYLAPVVSTWLFPNKYPKLSAEKKMNWDVHCVSLCQSLLINTLALWVMYTDEDRYSMDWQQRIWGYTGASGMIQGLAAGYFLWDLVVTVQHVRSFGFGMFMHAFCALTVFSFGFRPFVNFYGCTFILYELSSPFLNFHWFFDKLDMTGSRLQLYNGILLLLTFFSCRLIWGTYQSLRVYQDVWAAVHHIPVSACIQLNKLNGTANCAVNVHDGVMIYAADEVVPVWLAFTYLGSNIVLNTLNFFWFTKMIDAIRKRFVPQKEVKKEKAIAMKSMGANGTIKYDVDQTEVRRRNVTGTHEDEDVTGPSM